MPTDRSTTESLADRLEREGFDEAANQLRTYDEARDELGISATELKRHNGVRRAAQLWRDGQITLGRLCEVMLCVTHHGPDHEPDLPNPEDEDETPMPDPATLTPVNRLDGTQKEMSQRQLLANLEPGDVVWGKPHGGPDLRTGTVTRLAKRKREIEAKDSDGRTFWLSPGDLTKVALRHPERDTANRGDNR